MKIRLAHTRDVDAWMALVERVRNTFPGLETNEAMAEHRVAVLRFVQKSSAVCAEEKGRIFGALLFSKENGMLCFLAVDPICRRQHVGKELVRFALTRMGENKEITVTTYREGDLNGVAARAFYQHLGFSAGRLTEEFGYPVQEFTLKRPVT